MSTSPSQSPLLSIQIDYPKKPWVQPDGKQIIPYHNLRSRAPVWLIDATRHLETDFKYTAEGCIITLACGFSIDSYTLTEPYRRHYPLCPVCEIHLIIDVLEES